ncbi:MAG TPA: sugar transferase [Chloroflexota bacterium]|nr:sugar transferase [Chloroflexota bacterium]
MQRRQTVRQREESALVEDLAKSKSAQGTAWAGSSAAPDLPAAPASTRYLACKRVLDIVLAALAGIALSPVLVAIALLVRWTSPGPAIYRQRRIGQDRRPFTLYKFRSMYRDQSEELHRMAIQRFLQGMPIDGDATSLERYKLHADARITPVGRVLRRTSLDELPQLWNVIRGDMSLVGPRPPIPYELEHYEARHLRRLSVPPGLTGLWQVRGRSRVTFEQMVALDLEYIAHRSLLLDLKILLATVPTVLGGKGAG